MSIIIGLTGFRNCGKSTIASYLKEEHGFGSVHAFTGGKVAARAYFMHLGVSAENAREMVDGHLRDVPSPFLPVIQGRNGGYDHASPRYFLEMFGNFMAKKLGPEWTLGLEMKRYRSMFPDTPVVVESIVYEANILRNMGGIVVRVDRPGAGPKGLKTDEEVAKIVPDLVFDNSGDDLWNLARKVDRDILGGVSRILEARERDLAPSP